MKNLFKRAMVFTDIHLGLKSNGVQHNQDCLDFTQWMCNLAQQQDCDICLFLGDFHNNRNSINVQTLNYSLECLEIISRHFPRTIMIPGNHDLFYRDRRDLYSVSWARNIPNLEIINDFYAQGDCVFVPWLVGDEHRRLSRYQGQYMFGHFELPNFLMNSMVRMPDVGDVKTEYLQGVEQVFSGHFHKRQRQENIWYMGNCFPHNFSDAGDDDRGCMILNWGADPEFHQWPGTPRYRVFNISEIILEPEKHLMPNSYVRLNLDVDISYEEATFIKENFAETYNLRELSLISRKQDALTDDNSNINVKFESVDQIVNSQIVNISSDFYDNNLLLDIYRNL